MFTGIVQMLGTVRRVSHAPRPASAGGSAYQLTIEVGELAGRLTLGASVAVNGACLTVTDRRPPVVDFDVVPETWRRTTLATLRVGDTVNIEPALRVGDALDGHFVQGHVDGVGRVARVDRERGEWLLWVDVPAELLPFIVPKGSITLDGTSLTIVAVESTHVAVALVPTTLAQTTLGRRNPGDALNVETDILARLVAHQLRSLAAGFGITPDVTAASAAAGSTGRAAAPAPGITWEQLQAGGFAP